ncbi:EamA family transporter RarD [Sedimentitalea nanhaiensis]|uniref:Chloramphenicol-sensitive protein RarD n=1 Tax=Sedimentitalea nanhaiensis TaxID=999627 RepID=A0A1I7DY65_9RHOB|nr:EamA family transporter RarD [Sedimentitalea nanhaiensis]SFU16611.1 chloramphenicol-sensitive protein RarD [Sedimentitalea nanhaiensis]
MTQGQHGILAMIGAAVIWGTSPLYYKMLAHIPPLEVLAHRTFWSLVFFAGVLAVQGRLGEMRAALADRRRLALIVLAALLVSTNWFLFIFATQIGRNTETSLGYYIFPLLAVLIGRFAFGERLDRLQWLAVGLATLAVALLTWGLGVVPWISLTLAVTFGLYGAIKKFLPLGPVVSVTCEVLVILPLSAGVLLWVHAQGQGSFGLSLTDSVLLIASGPITALPLILFAMAARRVSMSTVGLLQYINPTLQFLCAVMLFTEPFTIWHQIAFPLIWTALALYSLATLRQDRAARRASIAVAGVSTQVTNSPSEASAKP